MEKIKQNSKTVAPGMRLLGVLVIVCLCGIALVPAVAAATSGTATAPDPWSGVWNTQGSTPNADQTLGVLALARTGSSVTGTFSNNDNGKGTITGTVTGNVLTGTWTVNYGAESDSGSFKFVLSPDKKTFAGTWVSGSDKSVTLDTAQDFWNGVRG